MRLPPLNALRAFEATARLGGFARASAELNVTPGAISRHVKLLEAELGICLFERLPQGVRPTPAALALLPKLSASFEMMMVALDEVPKERGTLKVMATPTFATRLLVPQLPCFSALDPHLVSVGLLMGDLTAADLISYDCAIATFHGEHWPDGVRVQHIREEALTPLAAPSLPIAANEERTITDLRRETLLHVAACHHDWPNWLKQNGLADWVEAGAGPSFETGELAIRGAAEGLGVVLMDRHLVQRELETGELVDLFENSQAIDNGYYFTCAERRWEEAPITNFRHWVMERFVCQ